ncbi:MAG: hypothetical protein ACR2G5_16300 [Pyrinomonadaceae bacterium]
MPLSSLLIPGTAKVKAQGRAYQDGYPSVCTGTPSHPSPLPPSPQQRRVPVEYTLKKAAREAADQMMTALSIRLPTALSS